MLYLRYVYDTEDADMIYIAYFASDNRYGLYA